MHYNINSFTPDIQCPTTCFHCGAIMFKDEANATELSLNADQLCDLPPDIVQLLQQRAASIDDGDKVKAVVLKEQLALHGYRVTDSRKNGQRVFVAQFSQCCGQGKSSVRKYFVEPFCMCTYTR